MSDLDICDTVTVKVRE